MAECSFSNIYLRSASLTCITVAIFDQPPWRFSGMSCRRWSWVIVGALASCALLGAHTPPPATPGAQDGAVTGRLLLPDGKPAAGVRVGALAIPEIEGTS